MRGKAWLTVVNALEYKLREDEIQYQDIEYIHLRDRPVLWLPAAVQSISILGRQILEGAFEETDRVRITPGDLWRAAGGDDTVGMERWAFWQQRLRALAEAQALDPERRDALAEAARNMDGSP